MPFKKGDKKPANSGRPSGRPPAKMLLNQSVSQWLAGVGYNPFETLRITASGEMPCRVCHGAGKTKYQSSNPDGSIRTCQSCWGSGKEILSPETSAKAASELAKYCQPQLKAIEVSAPGGGPVLTEIRVKLVEAKDGERA